MVRAASPVYKDLWPEAEIVVADALGIDQLKIALEDIDTAYYLIHSLLLGLKEFVSVICNVLPIGKPKDYTISSKLREP
jgi:hypothetical protein